MNVSFMHISQVSAKYSTLFFSCQLDVRPTNFQFYAIYFWMFIHLKENATDVNRFPYSKKRLSVWYTKVFFLENFLLFLNHFHGLHAVVFKQLHCLTAYLLPGNGDWHRRRT